MKTVDVYIEENDKRMIAEKQQLRKCGSPIGNRRCCEKIANDFALIKSVIN